MEGQLQPRPQILCDPQLSDWQFSQFQRLLAEDCGVQLDASRKPLIVSRLRARLKATCCADYDSYLKLIQQPNHSERLAFIDALTTHETYFFRERTHFDHMMNTVRSKAMSHARIWSAACSMGHEAYTAAMLMYEYSPLGAWRVIGTDIALDTLNKAKSGEYDLAEKTRIFDRLYKMACCEDADNRRFRFNDEILRRVQFQHFNLLKPFQPASFDFVFLRNVLIYFKPEDQKQIVENVVRALKPGGTVYLGHSEQLSARHRQLERVGIGAWKKLQTSAPVTPIKYQGNNTELASPGARPRSETGKYGGSVSF